MAEALTKEQKIYNLGYIIKLAAAAVNETQPPEPTDDVRFEKIYNVCKDHDIANTVFYAVEKLNKKPSPELYKKWRDERNMGIHRYMIQSLEAQELRKVFTENGVDFMPIKGFPVCALYPEPDYRYMGDLDYLLREKDLKRAGEIVKSLGYEPFLVGKVHHDEYKKAPLMVLELHHRMVRTTSRFSDYYEGIIDRVDKVGAHEYKMNDEDFYIFQLVHLNKHYESQGIGVRAFMDMYLLNKKMLPKLNRGYIDAELEKLELTEFFNFVEEIAEKWFGRCDVESFSEDEIYIFRSGVYGNDKHEYVNRKGDLNTGEFVAKRLFPSVEWMKEYYPILRKCILFLPATYVHRIFRGLIKKRKNIKAEIKTLKNQS